jgi:DNA polymerase-3 subunit delta'
VARPDRTQAIWLAPTTARPVARLWRAAREGRLPTALLFCGPRGIGKFRAARALAQGLLCRTGVPAEGATPCGGCGACLQVASGAHADLFVLDAAARDEAHLKLEHFIPRESGAGESVAEFLALRAREGGAKVLIVREAERTAHSQNEVQNALLKLLEEPRPGTLWVLETSRPTSLLETVRSRLVAVRFERLSDSELAQALEREGHSLAPELLRWARGSPGAALELERQGVQALLPLLLGALRGELAPLEAARAALAAEGSGAAGEGSALARARARARCALELAQDLLADAQRAAAGVAADTLAYGELVSGLPAGGAGERRARMEALWQAFAQLERNLDPGLVLERAWLSLAPSRPGAPAHSRS